MIFARFRSCEASFMSSYSIPVDGLAIYRILYATYVLTAIVPMALWIPRIPQAYYSPPLGIASFFSAAPSREVLWALNLILALCSIMLLLGWKTRFASIGTAFSLLLLSTWCYSFTKINHDILQILVPLVLAFSDWGKSLSLDSVEKISGTPCCQSSSWPLALLSLLVGTAMLTAGAAKLLSGWLDYDRLCTLGHLWAVCVGDGHESLLGKQLLRVQSHLFWKVTDWATIALECLLIVAAIHRRLFCMVLAVTLFFHLGVLLLFGIYFSFNVIAYGAFFDWSQVPLLRSLPSRPLWQVFAFFLSIVIVVQIAVFLSMITNADVAGAVVWIGGAAGLAYLLQTVCSLVKRSPRQSTTEVCRSGIA